ncbi:MAG: hypothetical protein RQ867_02505 [Mariprofundaceae bacterium]|nr:hypothetical protein [Mariprofundaceae bacterium]
MKKVISFLKGLFLDRDEQAFVRHNRVIWKESAPKQPTGEILVEENVVASSIVAISYVATFLAKKHDSSITVYSGRKRLFLSRAIRKIYESFNAGFIFYSDRGVRDDAEKLFKQTYPNLKTKRDVENLSVEGVPIGDLVYDTHLRQYLIPTIDLTSEEFKKTLKEGLSLYLYWKRYFEKHQVAAVIVSHCVYSWNAIILRVAVHRSIPVYQATAQRLYYITDSHNYRAYNEFCDYPKWFSELSSEERNNAYAEAEKRLTLRFSGHIGVDMHYSTQSAYASVDGGERVIAESSRVKILIATHCFFDSPHPYGINLFPDFYEWLSFLGDISERTDYDWYIKTHPDFLPGNMDVINGFLKKYSKFRLIPANTSHHQIIEEGIDFALTVYGTLGFEYAAQGVTVINASMCNPHVAYNFNIHPQTVDEYEKILLDLKNQKIAIDIKKVYEYYYCRFINSFDDWLYDDYKAFIQTIGGHVRQLESISYNCFLAEFSPAKHQAILDTLERFEKSKEYCLTRKLGVGHEGVCR